MSFPCSWCGAGESTERTYGHILSGGRMYPNRIHTCDRCHNEAVREQREGHRD